MEFKIDTKTFYVHITPVANLVDAKLTAALNEKWDELRQSGSQNLIIDLHNCVNADTKSFEGLLHLHESMYSNGHSLVFTNMQDSIIQQLKSSDMDLSLNIAPTMAEAIDIVNMEILERDLFNEES